MLYFWPIQLYGFVNTSVFWQNIVFYLAKKNICIVGQYSHIKDQLICNLGQYRRRLADKQNCQSGHNWNASGVKQKIQDEPLEAGYTISNRFFMLGLLMQGRKGVAHSINDLLTTLFVEQPRLHRIFSKCLHAINKNMLNRSYMKAFALKKNLEPDAERGNTNKLMIQASRPKKLQKKHFRYLKAPAIYHDK